MSEVVHAQDITEKMTNYSKALERKTTNVKGFCNATGIGIARGYELVRSGKVRSIKVGCKYIIPLQAIDEFLNQYLDKEI